MQGLVSPPQPPATAPPKPNGTLEECVQWNYVKANGNRTRGTLSNGRTALLASILHSSVSYIYTLAIASGLWSMLCEGHKGSEYACANE